MVAAAEDVVAGLTLLEELVTIAAELELDQSAQPAVVLTMTTADEVVAALTGFNEVVVTAAAELDQSFQPVAEVVCVVIGATGV